MNDVYSLKMGDPVFISAKHNVGMSDLYIAMKTLIEKISENNFFAPRNACEAEWISKDSPIFDSKNDILRVIH